MRMKAVTGQQGRLLLGLLTLLVLPLQAGAMTHNLYDDFPMSANPDGPWGFYAQGSTADGSPHSGSLVPLGVFEPAVPLTPSGWNPSFASWSQTGASGYGALVARHDPGFSATGDLFFSPAPVTNSVIRFGLPGAAALNVEVVVDVRDGDTNVRPDGQTFRIYHNDTALPGQSASFPTGAFPGTTTFMFSVVMNPGDALYFVNDPNNDAASDTLFIDASITTSPIPLPAAAWLFATVLAPLLMNRRIG